MLSSRRTLTDTMVGMLAYYGRSSRVVGLAIVLALMLIMVISLLAVEVPEWVNSCPSEWCSCALQKIYICMTEKQGWTLLILSQANCQCVDEARIAFITVMDDYTMARGITDFILTLVVDSPIRDWL